MIKYPRTLHLPWSLGRSNDDKVHSEEAILEMFTAKSVVVTEKTDGENSSIYSNGYCHARSLDSKAHESRTWLKALASSLKGEIPEGWRVCGENLFAQHSIAYDKLPSYFLVFGIYNEENVCLSWEQTKEWCSLLGLVHVPVLYEGLWNEQSIRLLDSGGPSLFGSEREGYVVRLAEKFAFEDFSKSVAKFVRTNHVQTDSHWMYKALTRNKLV